MNSSDILNQRLYNHHLIGTKFKTPEEVVGHLGAVQAQDYFGSMWSVGQRIENATESDIEKALNEGSILRTHVMRPTWHFVLPENIFWMQELTRDRVKQFMKTYNKKLELTNDVFERSQKEIRKRLQNHTYLTRQELKIYLEKIGIITDVQRLAHIIMWSELECLIVSGPRKGKQFTYALFEDRVKHSKNLSYDESLALIAELYFKSHGPAQLKDFAWWSGLTIREASEGISMIQSKLQEEIVNDKPYFFLPTKNYKIPRPFPSFLLSIYDEYTISYKDRSDLSEKKFIEQFIQMGAVFNSVLVVDGMVCGTWKRILKKDVVEVTVTLLRDFSKHEKDLVEKNAEEYGRFLQKSVSLTFK